MGYRSQILCVGYLRRLEAIISYFIKAWISCGHTQRFAVVRSLSQMRRTMLIEIADPGIDALSQRLADGDPCWEGAMDRLKFPRRYNESKIAESRMQFMSVFVLLLRELAEHAWPIDGALGIVVALNDRADAAEKYDLADDPDNLVLAEEEPDSDDDEGAEPVSPHAPTK